MRKPRGIREHVVYEPEPGTSRIATHWNQTLEVGTHTYDIAYRGHGPFVTVAFYDDFLAPTPRAKAELEMDQALALAGMIRAAALSASTTPKEPDA